MKTLCLQYTSQKLFLSLIIDKKIQITESFSIKEIKSTLLYLQTILATSSIKIEELDNICVNSGPAPAFTQRSLFALLNGIAMSMRLLGSKIMLFLVDDFKLLYTLQQQEFENSLIFALANAYSNDLFFFYSRNNSLQSGIMTTEECLQVIELLRNTHNIHIVGNLTDAQQQQFLSHGLLVHDNTISHSDYCNAALAIIQTQMSVEYLLPHYVKLHTAELKLQKTNNPCVK